MGRRIGINDIAYYAARVTVYEGKVFTIDCDGNRVKRDSVSHYRIDKFKATKFKEYWVGKRKKELVVEEVSLYEIFDKIRYVYDFNNILIARRNAPKGKLLITAKGMSKFLKYG